MSRNLSDIISSQSRLNRCSDSFFSRRLSVLFTFRHEAIFCSAGKWLSVLANCLAFACILLAFSYEAIFCSAGECFAVFTNRFGFTSCLRHRRTNGERHDQGSEEYPFHFAPPFG